MNVAYDYVFDGIYQKAILSSGYKAGDVRVKDLNGDGNITAAADRTVIGQTCSRNIDGVLTIHLVREFQSQCFYQRNAGLDIFD